MVKVIVLWLIGILIEVKGQYVDLATRLPTRSTYEYYNFETNYNNVTFRWRRENELGEFEMMMESGTDGYVAVGFCDPLERTKGQMMEHCDIVLGWIDDNDEVHIHDMFSEENGVLSEDSGESAWMESNFTNGNTTWPKMPHGSDNNTIIYFKRKASTGNEFDVDLTNDLIIIWAKSVYDPKLNVFGQLDMASVAKHLDSDRGYIPHPIRLNQPKLYHDSANRRSVINYFYFVYLLIWILLDTSI